MGWKETGVIERRPYGRSVRKYQLCVCDCGRQMWIAWSPSGLRSRMCIRCNNRLNNNSTVHGCAKNGKRTAGWLCWDRMRRRCLGSDPHHRKYYADRGIRICDRWSEFENFLTDMGEPPPGTSLDRINPDGNYEPRNCRWATRQEQARNTRSNRVILVDGRRITLQQTAEEYGLKRETIAYRLNSGWSVKRALTFPLRKRKTHSPSS